MPHRSSPGSARPAAVAALATAASPAMPLGNSLPLWLPGSSLQVRLSFQPTWTSSWSIDDVFLDSYSRR
jgi:hypothetical protein